MCCGYSNTCQSSNLICFIPVVIAEYFWEAKLLAYRSGPTNVTLTVPRSSVQHVVLRACRTRCCRLGFLLYLHLAFSRGTRGAVCFESLLLSRLSSVLTQPGILEECKNTEAKLRKGTLVGRKGSSSLTALLKRCIKGQKKSATFTCSPHRIFLV